MDSIIDVVGREKHRCPRGDSLPRRHLLPGIRLFGAAFHPQSEALSGQEAPLQETGRGGLLPRLPAGGARRAASRRFQGRDDGRRYGRCQRPVRCAYAAGVRRVGAEHSVERLKPRSPVSDGGDVSASGGAFVGGGTQETDASFPARDVPQEGVAGSASAAEREVLRRLHGFALEAATPLECMLFLSELKKRLNGE